MSAIIQSTVWKCYYTYIYPNLINEEKEAIELFISGALSNDKITEIHDVFGRRSINLAFYMLCKVKDHDYTNEMNAENVLILTEEFHDLYYHYITDGKTITPNFEKAVNINLLFKYVRMRIDYNHGYQQNTKINLIDDTIRYCLKTI